MMKSIDRARVLFKDLALISVMAWWFGFSPPGITAERNYNLATATVGGTFYPAGSALATLIKVKLQPTHKIGMEAIPSAGSGENIRLLRENKAQFALLSSLIGYYAWTGKGSFAADDSQTYLRAVTVLWQEAEHFVVRREYAQTGTIEDMKSLQGKKVSMGLRDSATIESNRLLLGNLGIDIDHMDLVYLGYDASAKALQKEQIEAMSTPAGTPVSAVTLAKNALGDGAVILEFTDAQLEKADGGLALWTRYVIEAGTYPTQEEDIDTIAAPSLMAVRADTDEEAVYQITRAIYENLAFLHVIHKALSDTRLDKALIGLPIPLHSGALRYYREVGLEVPARLIAE